MKTFKLNFVTFVFAVITLATLFFASCQKEQLQSKNINPPTEQALFTKDVTFTDASGRNTAVIRFSTKDLGLLEETDLAKLFNIEAVFEATPGESPVSGETAGEEPADQPSLEFAVVSQQLEPGASGLKFVFEPKSTQAIKERSIFVFVFTTFCDGISVQLTSGCATLEFFKRNTPADNFTILAPGPINVCANSLTNNGPINCYQKRVRITYNNAGFIISTFAC